MSKFCHFAILLTLIITALPAQSRDEEYTIQLNLNSRKVLDKMPIRYKNTVLISPLADNEVRTVQETCILTIKVETPKIEDLPRYRDMRPIRQRRGNPNTDLMWSFRPQTRFSYSIGRNCEALKHVLASSPRMFFSHYSGFYKTHDQGQEKKVCTTQLRHREYKQIWNSDDALTFADGDCYESMSLTTPIVVEEYPSLGSSELREMPQVWNGHEHIKLRPKYRLELEDGKINGYARDHVLTGSYQFL